MRMFITLLLFGIFLVGGYSLLGDFGIILAILSLVPLCLIFADEDS